MPSPNARQSLGLVLVMFAVVACRGPVAGEPGGDATNDADPSRDGDLEPGDALDGGLDATLDGDAEPQAPESWTILLYLAGDSDLEPMLLSQILSLEEMTLPDWLTVLALYDRAEGYETGDGDWRGTRLCRLRHDDEPSSIGSERLADGEHLGLSESGDDDELDMGAGQTLAGFIDVAQERYPADHYALFLSGHGLGWIACCNDEASGNDSLSVQTELRDAVAGRGIDLLATDACLLGAIETAWALKESVRYFVASEEMVPVGGLDLSDWLRRWLASEPTARSLASEAVESFRATYDGLPLFLFTFVAVDLPRLDGIRDALDDFVSTFSPGDHLGVEFGGIRSYDLYRIAYNAGHEPLMQAIREARVNEWHSGGQECPGGLSIFYGPSTGYPEIPFCQETDWCDHIPAE